MVSPPFVSSDPDVTLAHQWLAQGAATARHAALDVLPAALAFVDFETTRDSVVEVAVIRLQRGYWPTVFHSWINPGGDAQYRSERYWNSRIHGLTAPIVAPAPNFAAVAPTIWAMCADAVVVAHNAAFEHRHLVLEFARIGVVWNRPALCTLKLARRLLAGRRDAFGLDELAPTLHVRNPAPHRAMGDSVTTVWVLFALIEGHRAQPTLGDALREAAR